MPLAPLIFLAREAAAQDMVVVTYCAAVLALLFVMACNMDFGERLLRRAKWPVIVFTFSILVGLIAIALIWGDP